MSASDPRDALTDLFASLKGVFKRYDRTARRKAFDSLVTGKGRDEVNKLINNPTYQVTGIPRLLKFKEWAAANWPA
jgi:hypothetical protein